jgi:hypothetical protein
MNPIGLKTMWEDGGTVRADMIEILISLALLKLRSMMEALFLPVQLQCNPTRAAKVTFNKLKLLDKCYHKILLL